MRRLLQNAIGWAAAGILCIVSSASGQTVATIRNVTVFGSGSNVEVEVVASQPVAPQAQVITGPDRLVLDFPNSLPGEKLRNLTVERGELKGVRVGRFAASPPVTRVVLDLKSAQPYQIFPSGKTVIVKLKAPAGAATAGMQPTPPVNAAPAPVAPPAPRVQVSFANGKLRIWANRASLAEVLAEVRHRTGAELIIPPGTGQEPIVADLGPAPAREVLASLLNGSPFNFVMVGSQQDTAQLRGVFLTMRNGGGMDNSVSYPAVAINQSSPNPEPAMQPPPEDAQMPEQEGAPAQPEMAPIPPQEETPPQ